MRIRPFRPDDQPAAKALILAGLAEHWGRLDPTLNPDLDDIAASYADAVFLVAELDGQIVGTGVLVAETAVVGRIVRMSVARAQRRRGIARQLLAALIAAAQAKQYTQLVLETTATWDDAIGFYRAAGFSSLGVWEGDHHFVLKLGAA